jgi:fatty acid desaturase
MVDQEYQPYRSVLLSKGELAELNRLNFGRAVRDITWLWLQIITAWGIAAFQPRWWIIVLAAAFVGNRYYSLFIIGHDGLHRRLHPRQGVNDLVNDLFVLGPLAAITRINRRNHMRHHGTLACADDPDTYKYQPRWRVGPLAFLFSITGVPFVFRAIKNVYSGNAETAVTTSPRHAPRDYFIVIGWQILLCATLTMLFGWWGYPVMWLLPVYVFTFAADITRVFCEHSSEGDALHDRLVTFAGNRFELALFAPMNMNHHVAHHLWPSIPYYNLPKATEALYANVSERLTDVPAPLRRQSYLAYLRTCFARSRSGSID